MACAIARDRVLPCLSLDSIAWRDKAVRRPRGESIAELKQFVRESDEWIIEGCYGDLAEAALPFCTELRFLNPGVETCVEHCRRRRWEPEKFASAEAQDAMLDYLIEWVRSYETRDDEFGLKSHRRIFDAFDGRKREYSAAESESES